MADPSIKKWKEHQGPLLESRNGFDVIECSLCGFKHIIPIPTPAELEKAYKHEYYSHKKPLYLERHREDLDWWNIVYAERYQILEDHLGAARRRILDVGSGPGFFLLKGKKRGWTVKGIEPSDQAVTHSRGLGLDIIKDFLSEDTLPGLGCFDAVNMSAVLEHIPDPANLLKLVHGLLDVGGMLLINVPNDFNPFQLILRDHLGYKPWWVTPPHHINYFDLQSLRHLLHRCGFEILHYESTFPIDMFLLMGDNYIGNDELGRECHMKRKQFEKNLSSAGHALLKQKLYHIFAKIDLGREMVVYAQKLRPEPEFNELRDKK